MRAALIMIMTILGMTLCPAQDLSIRGGFGAVSPVSRAFAALELRHQIASRYFLAISGDLSMDESNVSPKLAVDLPGISLEAGFGWGHRWQKAGCSDHNYHTYTIGLMWSRSLSKHWSMYAGPSMYWRSYQGHIGLHRGTLRICVGMEYDIDIKH